VCISNKTEAETAAIAPSARTVVIENGRDHPRRWGLDALDPAAPQTIVTFGHHNNKRPGLVIDALSLVPGTSARLIVLGAEGPLREELRARAVHGGVGERTDFPGFVDEAEYRHSIATAAVVVLASSDEGFGLPVAEAAYFGIPAVVASDSGMVEIHEGAAMSAEPTPSDFARALSGALSGVDSLMQGRVHSWSETVNALRLVVGGGTA
jgi:glycosyltransferase involved in cell wall biosynthesis